MAPGLLSGELGDDPAADRAALRAALVDNAADLGAPGDDNTFGSGRVNGLASTVSFLPGPPTNVTAVAGDSQATVSWDAPAPPEPSPITQYTVTSTPGGLSATADGSASSATVTGLTDGIPYTFTVTAANAVGTSTASVPSIAVIPANEPPVVLVSQDVAANEGEVLSLQLATFTDPGISDTHTASVDWGDGSDPEAGVLDQGAGTVSGSHVYADDGFFTVNVTVTDNDEDSDGGTLTLNVSNVTPVVDAGEDVEVRAGALLDIGATFTDAGSDDTHTSTIQWGDGSGSEVGVLDQGAGTVSGSHVYTTQGAYELTVTATDDDGGSGFDSVTVIAIPGLTEWGLIVLGSVFGLLVLLTQRRRPNRRSGLPAL